MKEITVPELGEGVDSATVACWHAAIGKTVRQGDDILELVTDKATFNVEAPVSGVLKQIVVKEGEETPIGSVVGYIE